MTGTTRSELIAAMASRFPALKLDDVEFAVVHMLDKIIQQLAQGGRVEIRGFGAFDIKKRAARTARNPKTGEAVPVPARSFVCYKLGKILKEAVDRATL